MTELINPFFQKVFAVKESTPGNLIFPAQTDCVIGAGHIDCSQQASYTDSPEIRPSLNLKDQVKDKNRPGSWKLPILARPAGVDLSVNFEVKDPMGAALFECLQGKRANWSASLTGAVGTGDLTISFKGLTGDRPPLKGVFKLDNGVDVPELIFYEGITYTALDEGSFTGLTRGYGQSVAVSGVLNDSLAVASPTFIQNLDRPSFSLWYEQDQIVYFASGATVSEMGVRLENKGYPGFELSGGFISMGRAGKAQMLSYTGGTASPAVLNLASGEAKYFSVGARIYNIDDGDSNLGSGYEVTAVDLTNDSITLASCTISWGTNKKIGGYLPEDTAVGSPVRSEDSQMKIDELAKKPTNFEMNIKAQIQYVEAEISPDPISDYAAGRREIGGSLTQMFKNSELALFADAEQDDNKKSILIRLGDGTGGQSCLLWMPRCSLQLPKLSVSEPMVNIQMEFSALDQELEDSFALVFV
ncbi:MAG: hypothetical protein OEY59_00995 [Deltaproteobacteria bacterium]|nr:hypothetical protein [Deltaproteobacteria bacterium]